MIESATVDLNEKLRRILRKLMVMVAMVTKNRKMRMILNQMLEMRMKAMVTG